MLLLCVSFLRVRIVTPLSFRRRRLSKHLFYTHPMKKDVKEKNFSPPL